MTGSNDNNDLLWNLSSLQGKRHAVDFFRDVCEAFCVFSPTVDQLYSNYEVRWKSESDGLVVLPDPFAFHDTFSFIPYGAVSATGICVIPGDAVDCEDEVMMTIPLKGGKVSPALPIANALTMIGKKYAQRGREFLPVITRGDLREFRPNSPYLHLHVMNETLLTNHSSIDRRNIQGVIRERLTRFNDKVSA